MAVRGLRRTPPAGRARLRRVQMGAVIVLLLLEHGSALKY